VSPLTGRQRPGAPMHPTVAILKVVFAYALFSALWIGFSDQAVGWLFKDSAALVIASTAKGGVFVLVSSGLLFVLLKGWREAIGAQSAAQELKTAPPQTLRLSAIVVALALVVPALTYGFFRLQAPQIEREATDNLESIARLKAEQIEEWLAARGRDLQVLARSRELARQVQGTLPPDANPSDTAKLEGWFNLLRQGGTYEAALLLDADGHIVLGRGDHQSLPAATLELAAQAMASRQVRHGEIWRGQTGHAHQDWAVPISAPTAQGQTAVATIILRAAIDDFLFPLIQTWPGASASAETLLVRRDGDSVLFINTLRHRQDPPLTLHLPLTGGLPSSRAIISDQPGTMHGVDYRGVEVLAAFRPIKGTPWRIVAKIDRAEVLAPLWSALYWIGLIAFAALAGIILALLLLWRQQQLNHHLALQSQQSQANQLLTTLSDSSSDAIFIKDLQGRYLLVNREAARVMGRTAEQVEGLDDTACFAAEAAEALRANDRRVMAANQTETFEERITTVDGERVYLATKGPLRGDAGQVVGLFGISRDITERHRADASLKLQREALSLRNDELERFNRAAVSRELDMIELKRQVNTLSRQLGLAPPHELRFADPPAADASGSRSPGA